MQRPFRTSSQGRISLILRSEPGKKQWLLCRLCRPSPPLGSAQKSASALGMRGRLGWRRNEATVVGPVSR